MNKENNPKWLHIGNLTQEQENEALKFHDPNTPNYDTLVRYCDDHNKRYNLVKPEPMFKKMPVTDEENDGNKLTTLEIIVNGFTNEVMEDVAARLRAKNEVMEEVLNESI